jgi:peptidyl-prolyl cis-trans isomerase SurA
MDQMNILTSLLANRRHQALIVACAFAVLAGACRSTPATSATAASADAWAVVNGREIKRDEVEKTYRRTLQENAPQSEEEVATAKLGILNELIVQELLIDKARELKIELADTEVDKAFEEGKKNITPEAFEKSLAARNLTAADMREALRRDMLAQKVVDQEVVKKVVVTDQEVTDFFNANKAQFNRPEEAYHIAQIAVTPVPEAQIANRSGDDARNPQEAAAKTQMLMERLKAGVAFGDLAADFSEDPQSAPRGGDLGFIPLSRLQQAPPALRDAVLKSEPGAVRVVSNNGAHTIVLFVAKDSAGQKDPSMPAVKDAITGALRGRREQLLRAAYLTAVRNDAVVNNILSKRLVDLQGKALPAAPAAAK